MSGLERIGGQASYGLPGEELARFGDDLHALIVGSPSCGPLRRLAHGGTPNHLVRFPHSRPVLPRTANADKPTPRRADADRVKTTGVRS